MKRLFWEKGHSPYLAPTPTFPLSPPDSKLLDPPLLKFCGFFPHRVTGNQCNEHEAKKL